MKTKLIALLLALATATSMFSQTAASSVPDKLSPAETAMAQASRLIEKNPRNFEAYNGLALALSRRARETSDVKFYAQAEGTLQKSFEISPDNFDGKRIQVWLLLGKHEFAAAREEALKLSKRTPDDVMVRGFLTDANAELGNYDEAEKAAQLMLDLRPGNLPGITRAAYLRITLRNDHSDTRRRKINCSRKTVGTGADNRGGGHSVRLHDESAPCCKLDASRTQANPTHASDIS